MSQDAAVLTALSNVFTPHRPIDLPEFLAGRLDILYKTADAVNTSGLHVVLWGERGIGKTSIAHVLQHMVQEPKTPEGRRGIFVACSAGDDYSSIWKKVFQEIIVVQPQMGFQQFTAMNITGRMSLAEDINNPNDLRLLIQSLPNPLVIFIDEFDRVPRGGEAQKLMADTIKLFADTNVKATIVLVGVAQSINDLLIEHQSIGRNLSPILVEPMTPSELSEIVQKGFTKANMRYEKGLDNRIAELSQGYPHYTHLLALWAGRIAAQDARTYVSSRDLDMAVPKALENTTGSVRQEYERAIESSQPDNLFTKVILACALARKRSLGDFAANDLREPLREILKRDIRTIAYQSHLARFCEEKRGPVLKRTGTRRRYRWRFVNPQLIPFIRLQGIKDGLI